MSREVVTVGPDAGVGEAWGLCRERGIRHLPVVEGEKLVGIVSDRDLRDVSPPRATPDQENTLGYVRVREIMTFATARRFGRASGNTFDCRIYRQ